MFSKGNLSLPEISKQSRVDSIQNLVALIEKWISVLTFLFVIESQVQLQRQRSSTQIQWKII